MTLPLPLLVRMIKPSPLSVQQEEDRPLPYADPVVPDDLRPVVETEQEIGEAVLPVGAVGGRVQQSDALRREPIGAHALGEEAGEIVRRW